MQTSHGEGHSTAERRIGLGLALVAWLLFPVLLWRAWGCWNDVLVDYGRELYVPWRIGEGDVLYRDIAYFNGPLSPYWNALLFRVGGVGLNTLTIANLVVTALVGWLLHARLRSLGGPIAAGAGLVAFFVIFACGRFPGTGNYNFLAPYSHELTHGLLLGLLAFAAALRATRDEDGVRWSLITGFLVGLVFLTKAEVFVGVAGAVGCLFFLRRKSEAAGAARRAGCMIGASLVAPIMACALLALAMPFGDAWRGTLGSWTGIFGSQTSELLFYKRTMGMDAPAVHLQEMFQSLLYLLALLVPAFAIDRIVRKRGLGLRLGVGAAFAIAATVLALRQEQSLLWWFHLARFLPLIALGAFVWAAQRSLASVGDARRCASERASFALFGLLMMAKILLVTTVAHYGFALALIGSLVFVVVALEWLPKLAGGAVLPGATLRLTSFALIAITAVSFWRASEGVFTILTETVGSGVDAFRSDAPRGPGVNALLHEVAERLGSQQDLLVLPEGIMVNYLARRRTPTRHINFMPPELELFGEEAILNDLRAKPASALALIHKDTSDYGVPLFGIDYGQKIIRWAQRRYKADWMWGAPPLQPGTRFGIGFLGPK